MNVKNIAVAYALSWLSVSFVQAETLDEEVSNTIASTTGVITFLTSQASVSGGVYFVGPPNKPDLQFTTFKLPYRHAYPLHEDGSRWSMLIGYGRFDMTKEYDLENGSATSKWGANSLSAGIGYSNRIDRRIRWFTQLETAYTQIDHRYSLDSPDPVAFDNGRSLGDVGFNWHTTTLSFIASAGVRIPFDKPLQGWMYEPKVMYLYSKSIFENNSLEQVSANSGLFVNRLNFGEPWQFNFDTWGVAINPQISRTDAFGAVSQGLQTFYWYETNLNFRLKDYEKKAWWDGLEYGFSVLQGANFNGGQLSIGFSFNSLFGA